MEIYIQCEYAGVYSLMKKKNIWPCIAGESVVPQDASKSLGFWVYQKI